MNLRVDTIGDTHDPPEIAAPPLVGEVEATEASPGVPAADVPETCPTGDRSNHARAIVHADRRRARRWAISAAVVLLMHGAIVAAVVIWRKTLPAGPIVIDLRPAPDVTVVPAIELPPGQAKTNAAPTKPADATAKAPAKVEDKAGQGATNEPRVSIAPTTGADTETMPAPGGGAPPAATASPTFTAPLELIIPNRRPAERTGPLGLQNPLGLGQAEKARSREGVFGHPLNLTVRHMRSPAGAAPGGFMRNGLMRNGFMRNALGLPVQGTAGVRSVSAAPGADQFAHPGAAGGTVRNAIGAQVGVTRNAAAGAGATYPTAAAGAGALRSRGGINGTGMTDRSGAGAAQIGGRPRNSTGGISGNDFKPRY